MANEKRAVRIMICAGEVSGELYAANIMHEIKQRLGSECSVEFFGIGGDRMVAEGAEIINEENWGLKKLAYPIEKKSTGFYQLIEFKAEPTVIQKLEVNYRRDERVIRYMTTKLDKYAAEYAAKRRSVKSTKKED